MAGDVDLAAFEPDDAGPTALFLDTSGLFAHFHPDAEEHDQAQAFMTAIAQGELPYRPLFTSTYVVDELVTLLQSRGRQDWAVDAFEMLTNSENVTLLEESPDAFDAAGEALREYDDQLISFTDHLCARQMEAESIEYVFAYDGDYESLGKTVVPR